MNSNKLLRGIMIARSAGKICFPGWICLALLLLSQWAESAVLKLEDALELAGANHRDARLQEISAQEFELDLKDFRSRLLPRLSMRLTLPSINDQEQEITDTNGQITRVRVQSERRFGSVNINEELPFGTNLSAGFSVSKRSSDTDSYQYPWDSNYNLSIQQQLFGSNWLWHELQSTRRQLELQELRISEELADFRHRVTVEYYTLLQAQLSHDLERKGLRESEANLKLSERKYQAGIIAESDFLKLELEALERSSRFAGDSLALLLSEERFRLRLGVAEDQELELDALVPVPAVQLDYALHREQADQASLDLLENRRRLLDARRQRGEAWRNMLPRFDLSMSWDQSVEDSTFNRSFADARLYRSLSLRMQWPLFEWGDRKRAFQRSRMAERRARLAQDASSENLELSLKEQLNRIRELQGLIPLRARQLELAEKDYKISQQRFEAGQITGQLLIDAERTLSSVRLRELSSRISLVLAVADLNRLTGADREVFQAWK